MFNTIKRQYKVFTLELYLILLIYKVLTNFEQLGYWFKKKVFPFLDFSMFDEPLVADATPFFPNLLTEEPTHRLTWYQLKNPATLP